MNHLKILKKSHAIKKNNSKTCKFPTPTPIKFLKSPFWYIKPSLGGYLLPKPVIAKVMIMKYANNYPNVFHLISWKIECMERNEQDYGARSDFKQARWLWMKFFVTNEKWMFMNNIDKWGIVLCELWYERFYYLLEINLKVLIYIVWLMLRQWMSFTTFFLHVEKWVYEQ